MARRRRRQDSYGHRARKEGFPARSVYKLEEIHRRIRLFEQGQRVLDLGASPGSWTLFAAQKVGKHGLVRSLDLKPATSVLPANVDYRVLDAFAADGDAICEGGRFDIVLSDMAPSTTGHRDLDQYRSYELFLRALTLAAGALRPGGTFVGKIFQGAEFEQARDAMRPLFEKIRIIRPKATRDESYELFLIGLVRRDDTEPGTHGSENVLA